MKKAALGLALALVVGLAAVPAAKPAHGSPAPQNVVLILTDDQRWDSLQYMPNVESLLADHGVSFANAFDNDPLCCPTRATIMTGLTSGHNGVWGNINGDDGGFTGFLANGDENRQVFGWMHDAGYRTALIGKFLNGYAHPNLKWTMPGVDDWQAFVLSDPLAVRLGCRQGGYFGTCYSNNGTVEVHPAKSYSTTTSGQKAMDFIQSTPPDQPLFLYYAPRAPHLPTTPQAVYANACRQVAILRPPSYNREIVFGPMYMDNLPTIRPAFAKQYDTNWLNACRTLLSVDDRVGDIVQALSDTGRLDNTLIMFASDNGFMFGEHRWHGKFVPYEESIRVPVIVRDDARIPPQLQGTTVTDQITSLDYTPTFLEAANLSRTLDGQSLFPLVGAGGSWVPQDSVLIEHARAAVRIEGERVNAPAYCGVRNTDYMYAQYKSGEEELYDLQTDPNELVNVASVPQYAATLDELRSQTHQLCDPPPPGFVWAH